MADGLTLTGSCYWVDEHGELWLAESWVDASGVVTTAQTDCGPVS